MADTPLAPPPWKLKGQSWAFLLSSIPKNASFPSGFSAPFQAEALTSGGEFVGTPGMVQLISYTESPVGPYDELIYIPGRWNYKGGQKGYRITRIYVSTVASTLNGRRNWDIPKQVADFKYESIGNGLMSFTVSHPGSSIPFFKATVKDVPVISKAAIPLNTTYLGKYFSLVQPPLPAGSSPEEVATEKWAELTPVMQGKSNIVSLTAGFEGGKVGDGEGFPAVKPWSLGIHMDLDLDFGESTFYDAL